jgi:NitT/TauT family transport system ATP-binding protein
VTDAIVFDHVSKGFGGSARDAETFWAVQDLSFTVATGEVVAVVGKTGCGKSTMFNLVAGLIAPSDGSVVVDGYDSYRQFNALKGRMAIIFQNDRLMPWRTALDNVCLGLELEKMPQEERYEIGRKWLARLNLSGHENDYPHQLSGGMKQRVAIARAFSVNPDVLLCDEPFSALDEITAGQLRDDFNELVQASRITAMFITHNIQEALTIAHRVLVFAKPAKVMADVRVGTTDAEKEEAKAVIRKALAL